MNQIIMILLISVLVLVHELGHFIAARMCNVRVTRFGIGMPIGPSWKLFKWKDTVFYIHAFLFGGYVSFAEAEPQTKEEKEDKGLDDSEYLPSDSVELYDNKTITQKLFVVSAGVLMNIVFAVFLVIAAAIFFQKLPQGSQVIYISGFSDKTTSNAQVRGLEKNDKFVAVNGKKINSLYQLSFFAQNSKLFDNFAQKTLIEKNLIELKKLNPKIENTIKKGTTVVLAEQFAENPLLVNDNVLSGLEKYKKQGIELNKSQIELRNKILNKKTYTFDSDTSLNDLAIAMSDTYKPLSITVLRNNKEIVIDNIKVNQEGVLGVLLEINDVYQETKTPRQIIVKSINYLYTTTATMLFSLWQLITGKVSASDMHGVIAIVKVGGDIIASKGMLNGLLLTAMISINLAIMNLLPIPALDGGHIAFLIVEKITGKKPSQKTAEKINNFFFILLILLMIAICYNDIFALVTKKF